MMFSQNLKKLRKNCGLTQSQVADALNVDRSTYAYYESGKTTPDISTIVRLSKIFNVSYEDLLDNDKIIPEKLSDADGENQEYQDIDISNYKTSDYIYELSKQEKTLIGLFRVLPPSVKEIILTSVKKKVFRMSNRRSKKNSYFL